MSEPTQPIRLYLLGGVALRGVDERRAAKVLAQSKLAALLAVLSLAPEGRLLRRDKLVGLLWPELDQPHARTALRKAIHAVRALLGAESLTTRGDEEIGLDAARVWCDASDLRASADAGRLQRVVDLYSDELMPGFYLAECTAFERWLDDERVAARERASAATWALAVQNEAEGQLTVAGSMAKKAVRFAWDDERVLRRTLTMLARIGDRAGALKLADEFVSRMRSELDASPAPETAALIATLRSPS